MSWLVFLHSTMGTDFVVTHEELFGGLGSRRFCHRAGGRGFSEQQEWMCGWTQPLRSRTGLFQTLQRGVPALPFKLLPHQS